ncbi:unnamed protein product [Allacma fusca]|uniref:Beta/gamma crystallin 'Greek key' domain-containing protein n=1 Tax=Allacma fusca TaxID=39272 RepID=A0A8J2Q6Y3_9HEXA|nr:unnamed protein product [Allacma fusca]
MKSFGPLLFLFSFAFLYVLGTAVGSRRHHYIERRYDESKEMDEMKLRVRILEEQIKATARELNNTRTRIQLVESVLNPGFLQVVYDVLALNKYALSMKGLDAKPPRATLFEEPEYQGRELEFNPEGTDQFVCTNFGDLEGKISSIKTYDSCVRLYGERDCEGENEFISPFSSNTNNLGNTTFRSITGCTPAKIALGQSWRAFQNKHVVQAGAVHYRPRTSEDCYHLVPANIAHRPVNSLIFATPGEVLQDFNLQQRGDQLSRNGRTICSVRTNRNGRSAELCDGSRYQVTIDNDAGQNRPVHFAGHNRDRCRRLP